MHYSSQLRFALALEDQFVEGGSICKEYDKDDYFVGQRPDCLAPSFQVSRNLYEGYFVVVWPVDGDS
jgi:hypothetical protein